MRRPDSASDEVTTPVSERRHELICDPRVGWVTDLDADGTPRVDFVGNLHGPLRVRSTVPLMAEALRAAAISHQAAVLLFERGDPTLPLLVGLVQAPGTSSLLEELLDAKAERPQPHTVEVDGKRLIVEGHDEVVLRCGEASITLRRNGRVVIRGTELETRASGIHRIKGGKVEIN